MNTTYAMQEVATLAPVRPQAQLAVIQGVKSKRGTLVEALASQMFGYLHGNDFSSDVHDVLDAHVRPNLLGSSRERVFAALLSGLATCALFVLSFM